MTTYKKPLNKKLMKGLAFVLENASDRRRDDRLKVYLCTVQIKYG